MALAGENITNLKCLGLFCSLGNFFWLVYNDTGYIDIWVITLFMGLDIASLNWNLVTLVTFKSSTNALVCLQQMFLSCFMITLFTFKHSCQGLCGESTQPNNVFFLKYELNRNHQDKITFKHYPNLLATIFRTFWWSFLITLLTFILDSFMLTLFMHDKILFFNCFIITLV